MFQAVRHVLPVLPPLALLAVRSLRPNEARIRDPSDRVDKEQLPAALDGRLARIQEKTYYSPIPLQTMGPGSLFYGVSGGNVPYIFTRERKLETFRVYRVDARRGARPAA